MSTDVLPTFPPHYRESPEVLRALIKARSLLAGLNGIAHAIPNPNILITTLTLQEAQSSSEVENIVTTQDRLYRQRLYEEELDMATKEVAEYATSLGIGFDEVKNRGILTINTIRAIQENLERNRAGFRRTPGVVLRNDQTGEVVYEPPSPQHVERLMSELERYINEPNDGLDPLVRMALIHHRFETIHPFYDGNGRTGRIINILYLVKEGLLSLPILYLSRYLNQTKPEYYRLLQGVRDDPSLWEEWVLYVIEGVSKIARHTGDLVTAIRSLFAEMKREIREQHKFYSQDLINNIFRHPYTKVAILEKDLDVSRATATRYLDALAEGGILEKDKLGRENIYINFRLFRLLDNLPDLP